MPAAVGFISTVVASVTTSVVAATALYYGTYAAISIGIGFGLQALNRALMPTPQAPKPEDVQQSVRQATAPRVRHYGRVKVSGPWVFAETEKGNFHKVIALGEGRLDAIEEYWIDDTKVELEENGTVKNQGKWNTPKNPNPRILSRLGNATETAYSQLASLFNDWTSAHRGDGISSVYIRTPGVGQSAYLRLYPNGINTKVRVVARASRVKNPKTGTVAWDDKAASIVMDYLVHKDGMRMPEALINTSQAVQGWRDAYDRAAEAISLAGGGTEPRYRLWGSYRLDERPADVVRRMLACCDGRLIPTPDGGLTLDIGAWEEPTLILDDTVITGFSGVGRGRDVMETANTIRATYLAVDNDYQAIDADPFADEADVEERGEIAVDRAFDMAPSHSQARRLMKLELYRSNPLWVGTFQCNLKAMNAINKRFVRVVYPKFGINEVMEVQAFRMIVEAGILRGVQVTVQSMPPAAYQWDPSQEGTAPEYDQSTPDNEIPRPTGFDVTINRKNVGGSLVPYAVLSFDPPPSQALKIEAEGKRVIDTSWTPIAVAEDATSADSFTLSDGEDYEFRIRHVTIAFREGDWVDPIVITAVADPTPPDQITGATATGGAGVIDYAWVSPNSQNFAATNIYRNTVDDEATATLVRTEYGPQSNSDSWQETGLGAGTYYAWLAARNASGVEAEPRVATGPITVT